MRDVGLIFALHICWFSIANTLNPAYLVVELTGIGPLSSIIQNIGKIEYERIELLSPVVIVDVHCVKAYLAELMTIYEDQIQSAKVIILSKVRDATNEQI